MTTWEWALLVSSGDHGNFSIRSLGIGRSFSRRRLNGAYFWPKGITTVPFNSIYLAVPMGVRFFTF